MISPDGAHVLYDNQGLVQAPVAGGTPRRLSAPLGEKEILCLRVSPDSRWAVYSSGILATKYSEGRDDGLYSVPFVMGAPCSTDISHPRQQIGSLSTA